MRHRSAHRKLGRKTEHRISLLRNLAASLISHGRIRTTEAKAKELRPFVEKLVTLGKRDSLHARRHALSIIPAEGGGVEALQRRVASLLRASGRLHPDPEARAPPGRRRLDGLHRVRGLQVRGRRRRRSRRRKPKRRSRKRKPRSRRPRRKPRTPTRSGNQVQGEETRRRDEKGFKEEVQEDE